MTPPRRGTPAEAQSSLGLSVEDSPAAAVVSLDEITPPRTPAETPSATASSSTTPALKANAPTQASPASVPFPSSPSPPLPSPPVRRESASSRAALQRAGSPSLRVDIPPAKPQHTLAHHGRHHSHIGASSQSAPIRPSPMIRKKSGELVRPALKSRTSFSTPNSAGDDEDNSDDRWNQCRSAPATPGDGSERKTLRFAGGDGDEGELERVVLFKREHKVTAVTRVLEGEDLERVTDTETEGEGASRSSFGSVWASPRYSKSPSSSSSSSGSSDKDKVEIHRSESTAVPRIPGLNLGDNSRGRPVLVPEYDQVVLETMELIDEGGPMGALTLKGTVLVRNMTFGKWVAIRFSESISSAFRPLSLSPDRNLPIPNPLSFLSAFDEWQTVSEVSAVHAIHVPASQLGPKNAAGQGWDRFSFSVKLDDVRRKITERHLLLAIRYSIEGGAEWWDSNDGANYKVRFKKTRPVVVAPAQVTRSRSDIGGAFLPLLEAKKHTAPTGMFRSHSAGRTNSPPKANTHQALPDRLPSALHTAQTSTRSQPWTFPNHYSADLPRAQRNPSPPSVHSILKTDPTATQTQPAALTTSPSSSPLKLKNYCPPTSPPTSPPKDLASDSSRFGKFATVSGGSGSGTSSPVRPGHTRSRSSVSIGGGSRDFGTFPPPAYMRPVQSSFPPMNPPSAPSVPTMQAMVSTAPLSPPMSANHSPPSPTDSLLATPLPVSSSVMVSPGVMTFELPDLGVEASGNPKKRVSPVQKEVNLPSTSYNDFINKYCFFQGAPTVSPPSSASASPLNSTTYLPFSGNAHLSASISPNRSPLSSGQTTPQGTGSGTNSPHGVGQTMSFLPPAWNVATPSSGSGSDGGSTPTGLRMPAGGVFWGTEATGGAGSPPKRSPPAAAGGAGRVIPAMRG